MQDQRRAAIVGSRSFGKGSAQAVRPIIPDDESAIESVLTGDAPAITITSSKWFSLADRSIQGQIDPKTDLEITCISG